MCGATYVVLRGRALAGERTAEEGAQEGIQHGRHSIDINNGQQRFDVREHPLLRSNRAGRRELEYAAITKGAWRKRCSANAMEEL